MPDDSIDHITSVSHEENLSTETSLQLIITGVQGLALGTLWTFSIVNWLVVVTSRLGTSQVALK